MPRDPEERTPSEKRTSARLTAKEAATATPNDPGRRRAATRASREQKHGNARRRGSAQAHALGRQEAREAEREQRSSGDERRKRLDAAAGLGSPAR